MNVSGSVTHSQTFKINPRYRYSVVSFYITCYKCLPQKTERTLTRMKKEAVRYVNYGETLKRSEINSMQDGLEYIFIGRGYINMSVYICIDECTLKESTAIIRTQNSDSSSLQAVDYKERMMIDGKLMEVRVERNEVNLSQERS